MIDKFLERLSKLDNFKVELSYKDCVYSLTIVNNEIGELYSYSSTNLLDLYNRVDKFITALEEPDSIKFFSLLSEIANEELVA